MLSANTCHEENNSEKRSKSAQPPLVDYGNVALYIPVAQVCFALGMAQAVVLLIPLVVQGSTCGVRTIAIAVTCGSVLMSKRIRLGDARGADALFESLRPMLCVWIVALVMEQLLRSCGKGSTFSTWRAALFHGSTLFLTTAGFARANRPCSNADWQFILSFLSLVAMAIVPPSYDESDEGPLCTVPDLMATLDRMSRTLSFALLYSTMTLVEAARRFSLHDIALTVCRATAASVWALVVHRFLLLLVPLQIVGAVVRRIEVHEALYSGICLTNASDTGTDDDDDVESQQFLSYFPDEKMRPVPRVYSPLPAPEIKTNPPLPSIPRQNMATLMASCAKTFA